MEEEGREAARRVRVGGRKALWISICAKRNISAVLLLPLLLLLLACAGFNLVDFLKKSNIKRIKKRYKKAPQKRYKTDSKANR